MSDAPRLSAVREKARAKVNLTLRVKGRRADGYHELESLAAFAAVHDRVSFRLTGRDDFRVEGPFAGAIDGENLILKAKRAVSDWLGRDIQGEFVLAKDLPVAAGLGGGSSDAAAAIRALFRALGTPPAASSLPAALAARIGADVPVCLGQRAAMMRGLGERVTPVYGLCPLPALLVNPGVKLSTRAVFARLNAVPYDEGAGAEESPALFSAGWDLPEQAAVSLVQGRNDLEPAALALEPVIAAVLGALGSEPGCLLARLSGSGPTCFGLFSSVELAQEAETRLRVKHPGWWITATVLS